MPRRLNVIVRRKPSEELQAIQWENDNLSELIAFLSNEFEFTEDTVNRIKECNAILFKKPHTNDNRILKKGEYLVHESDGEYYPYTVEEFNARYDLISR